MYFYELKSITLATINSSPNSGHDEGRGSHSQYIWLWLCVGDKDEDEREKRGPKLRYVVLFWRLFSWFR